MSDRGRQPVLVGVAAVSQREADVERALEPSGLMARALEAAAADAGGPAWLERIDRIAVPRGFWDYSDPGRLVAETVGAAGARTALAEIGVLQTSLFARACRALQAGEAEVVAVVGGEAKHREKEAKRVGSEAPLSAQCGAEPDETWRPAADILHPVELSQHLGMPVRQYAVIENALRSAEGKSLLAHREEVARLWAAMSEVAVENPDAWSRKPVAAEVIRDPGPENPMLAFPYGRLHTSQWNVDQAAALLFTTEAVARAAGVPEAQWIRPRAVVESNHMLPLVERAELHRCPAFGIAACRALGLADLALEDVSLLELYSCFPSAVRVQQRELGLPLDGARPPSLTGGMAFAGGPLNNFVLQAAVRMARKLRESPGANGLLTAVSGMLTKQGLSLWSTLAGPDFAAEDVGEQAQRQTGTVEVEAGFSGTARIEGYTVLYDRSGPTHTVLLARTGAGRRAVVAATGAALADAAVSRELTGLEVEIAPGEARLAG